MTVERCPICGGNGIVSAGFYTTTTGQWLSTDTVAVTCRACNGKGCVVV